MTWMSNSISPKLYVRNYFIHALIYGTHGLPQINLLLRRLKSAITIGCNGLYRLTTKKLSMLNSAGTLWGEFTGHRGEIPSQRDQWYQKRFHIRTWSCSIMFFSVVTCTHTNFNEALWRPPCRGRPTDVVSYHSDLSFVHKHTTIPKEINKWK